MVVVGGTTLLFSISEKAFGTQNQYIDISINKISIKVRQLEFHIHTAGY